jgi:hypothetical protein
VIGNIYPQAFAGFKKFKYLLDFKNLYNLLDEKDEQEIKNWCSHINA